MKRNLKEDYLEHYCRFLSSHHFIIVLDKSLLERKGPVNAKNLKESLLHFFMEPQKNNQLAFMIQNVPHLKVMKNTIAKKAAQSLRLDAIQSVMKGSLVYLAFHHVPNATFVKHLLHWIKENDLFILGGIYQKRLISRKDLELLSHLFFSSIHYEVASFNVKPAQSLLYSLESPLLTLLTTLDYVSQNNG